MKPRKIVIGALLIIIGLPVLSILTILLSVSLANRTNGTIVSSGEKREPALRPQERRHADAAHHQTCTPQ